MTGLSLVADLGGTNVRFALVDAARPGELLQPEKFPVKAFCGIVEAARRYLDGTSAAPSRAAIAVAGPVRKGAIHLTNLGWRFSGQEVARALGMQKVALLNDFEAIALAVPHLRADDLVTIGPEISRAPAARETVAIAGPGTGFGVGGFVRDGAKIVPLVTEGGHADFAPGDDVEIEILKLLRKRFGHVSNERILSGPGLVNLHEALCAVEGRAAETLSPQDITARASADASSFEGRVFARFCAILGAVAGDVALVMGARGGVLLAGGILPAMRGSLGPLRARFEAKGRFAGYMKSIPTHLIVQDRAGLTGAAASLAAMQD